MATRSNDLSTTVLMYVSGHRDIGLPSWLTFLQVALKLYRAGVSPLPYEPGIVRSKFHLDRPPSHIPFVTENP